MSGRIRALALLIAVFCLGLSIGAGGVYLWAKRITPPPLPPTRPASSAHGGDGLVKRLQLRPDQQAQLKTIYDDLRKQIDAYRVEMDPKMKTIRTQANERIYAILDSEQKKKFDQVIKDQESRMERSGRKGDRNNRGEGGLPPPPSMHP